MKIKEKVLLIMALLFVVSILGNYAYVNNRNSNEIIGEFTLATMSNPDDGTVLANSKFILDNDTIEVGDEVKMIFNKNETFVITNLEQETSGTYEIERTMSWNDDVVILLSFNDDTESYAAFGEKHDLVDQDFDEETLVFSHDGYIFVFTK